MNGWMTPMELQIVAAEVLREKTRERVLWNPTRGRRIRDLVLAVLSLVF